MSNWSSPHPANTNRERHKLGPISDGPFKVICVTDKTVVIQRQHSSEEISCYRTVMAHLQNSSPPNQPPKLPTYLPHAKTVRRGANNRSQTRTRRIGPINLPLSGSLVHISARKRHLGTYRQYTGPFHLKIHMSTFFTHAR